MATASPVYLTSPQPEEVWFRRLGAHSSPTAACDSRAIFVVAAYAGSRPIIVFCSGDIGVIAALTHSATGMPHARPGYRHWKRERESAHQVSQPGMGFTRPI